MQKEWLSSCRRLSPIKHAAGRVLDGNLYHPQHLRFASHQRRCHHQTAHRVTYRRYEVTRTRIETRRPRTPCLRTGDTRNYHTRSCSSQASQYVSMSSRAYSSCPPQPRSSASFHGTSATSHPKPSKYVVALGSNMGDRVHWIELACREMEAAGVRVYATSGLWQTKAMYVEDQDDFLNGVCLVETSMRPVELMTLLQGIENKMGRVKVVDKGPRNIDLDIVLWEGGEFRSVDPDLVIPHRLMEERDFVLAPLCQLLPRFAGTGLSGGSMPDAFVHNSKKQRYTGILDRLWHNGPGTEKSFTPHPISACTQLSKTLPSITPADPMKKTHIMSIVNLTPDSFSDGGQHAWNDERYLTSIIKSHLAAGATIFDLGGQSSRPGALDISASEEIARLTPALGILSALRHDLSIPPFAVSVDTYRASVAAAAVAAGADIVNDISAGTLDKDMLPTVADLGCSYVLMHMRGTPHTMTSRANTTYDGDLIHVIRDELRDRVAAAEEAGIRRWRMILDPGIGFAKTAAQNLEILRRLSELTSAATPGRVINGAYRSLEGLPWLVGSSRKGFVGKITGVRDASERTWGTAATVAAAVSGGADLVRVHDVKEMTQVARMSEAIWRGSDALV